MSSLLPLRNFRVLITRPEAQQQALKQALTEVGANPISMPLLSIEPVPPSALLRQKIQQLDNYDTLIFVSTNAAELGAQQIDQYWPQFPAGVMVAAIGPGTARTLEQMLHCKVVYPQSGVTSEDLLKLAEFSRLEGKKIALFRGLGGRELLPARLTQGGAKVDIIELYQRQTVVYAEGYLQQLLEENDINTVAVSSGEALTRLCQLAGINKAELGLIPLLVPSDRIRQQALIEGFQLVIDCKGADPQSVLAGLRKLARK